ncbi:transporter [Novipirellula herctigrandis]
MGDHLHEPGKWMVEYKYMNMFMEDNRIGENTISDSSALGTSTPVGPPGPGITTDGITTNRAATPTQMTMEMHMAHVMYGATDDITLYTMAMLPNISMDHTRADFTDFTTSNSGFGDMAFGALLRLYSDDCQDWILNLGCSVPTGDIFETTSIPTGSPTAFPYPMRLGSGTFNMRPGITFKRYYDWYSWGMQFQTDLPIGHNYRGYRVGEEYRFNSWNSILLTDNLSVSMRGEHLWRTAFDGKDPEANGTMISTNVEQFRGGYWYSLGFGAQYLWGSHYFNAEIVPTIAQEVDGVQLETDYAIIASWSRTF